MKGRQFIRKLRRAGVLIVESRGKGGHQFAIYQGRRATVPFHGDDDLSPHFLTMICKQLGLDPHDVL